VAASRVAPVLVAIGNQSVDEHTLLTFVVSASHQNSSADTLSFGLDGPSVALGMSIDISNGSFAWTPSEGQGGVTYEVTVTVTVTDDVEATMTASETFWILVMEINLSPVMVEIANQSVDEQSFLTFNVSASYQGSVMGGLSFSLDAPSQSSGMMINSLSGVFEWTPSESQGGAVYEVTVTVQDDDDELVIASKLIWVSVNEVNVPPVLAGIGNLSIGEQSLLMFTVPGFDQDIPTQSLAYSIDADSRALGMSIDPQSGSVQWTTTEEHGPQVYGIEVTLTDGIENTTQHVLVTVSETNLPPLLGEFERSIYYTDEGNPVSIAVNASDEDIPAQTMTFTLDAASLAMGATIQAETGDFQWLPSEAAGGSFYDIVVTVTDDGDPPLSANVSFSVDVGDTNMPPVLIHPEDQIIIENVLFEYFVVASDIDVPEDNLVFSLDPASELAGMNINALSGLLTWTPAEAQAGQAFPVTVEVTDDGFGEMSAKKNFTITVQCILLFLLLGLLFGSF
jgi:hypothetical protein